MNASHLAALAVLALSLAGCTASVSQDPFLTAATATGASAPALSSEVSADFATASLPPSSGRVVSVSQTIAGNGLQQIIVYGNRTALAGENVLSIDFGTADTSSRYLHAPTRAQIVSEMRAAMPGVRMQIQDIIGDNAQGVFGYATGKAGARGSCLYGWQLVKGSGLVAKSYSAQVRVRVCDPSMGEDQIVSLMQGLQVRPVTAETIRMLRLAGNSGAPAFAANAFSANAMSGNAIAREDPTPVRRTVRRAPAADDFASADTSIGSSSVSIPLPSGGATNTRTATSADVGVAVAVEPVTPTRGLDDAAAVPLPR